MNKDQYGQLIYNSTDICDLLMRGHDISRLENVLVDSSVDLTASFGILDQVPNFKPYQESGIKVEQFDRQCQENWYMPDECKNFDIAEYVLSLCQTQEQLQRVGHELLLFQERGLFELLKYLKYLVDTMKENKIIWGVGRGSSVASYVLYLLGVHKIDSMYYDLDPEEFLR